MYDYIDNTQNGGLSDRERAENRECQREHRASWFVAVYRANYSAFNGYHRTPSDYSQVNCGKCGRVWRTKAAYADTLPSRSTALDHRPSS